MKEQKSPQAGALGERVEVLEFAGPRHPPGDTPLFIGREMGIHDNIHPPK